MSFSISLDIFRNKKRANMENFPGDVRLAEEKTGGDPDILESEEFAPEEKPNIAQIFGDQTPKLKKGKGGPGRKRRSIDKSLDEASNDNSYSKSNSKVSIKNNLVDGKTICLHIIRCV